MIVCLVLANFLVHAPLTEGVYRTILYLSPQPSPSLPVPPYCSGMSALDCSLHRSRMVLIWSREDISKVHGEIQFLLFLLSSFTENTITSPPPAPSLNRSPHVRLQALEQLVKK